MLFTGIFIGIMCAWALDVIKAGYRQERDRQRAEYQKVVYQPHKQTSEDIGVFLMSLNSTHNESTNGLVFYPDNRVIH